MYISEIDEIVEVLEKCKGWRVNLWHYEPTLSKVVLRLEPPSGVLGTHLVCVGTHRICGPLHLGKTHLKVIHSQGEPPIAIVAEGGFQLECDLLLLVENVGMEDPPLPPP